MLRRIEKADIGKVITESMEKAEPLIADRQRAQMLEGLNSKGQKIRRYRSNAYAKMKHAMNPVPGFGNWDMYLTGALSKSIYAEVRGDAVIIDATDPKTQGLVEKAGEIVFGLNKSTKAELIKDDLQPIVVKRMRNELKL